MESRLAKRMKESASALFDKVVDKVVNPWVVGFAGTVLATLGRQVTDLQFIGRIVLPLFFVLLLIATPFLTVAVLRPRRGWVIGALAIGLGLDAVLLLFASVTTAKGITIDRRFPVDSALQARLPDSFPLSLRHTAYNEITVVTRPVVATDFTRATYVLIEFLWTKRDGPARTYAGRALLQGERRPTTSGGWSVDPFVMKDLSITPKQGWTPYLFGWLETPLLLAEPEYFTRWATELLAGPAPRSP